MVTRKAVITAMLVPLAVCTLLAAGGSGGPPPTQKDLERRFQEGRIPSPLDRLRDTTHRPINPRALAALHRLQEASHQRWQVKWDTTTGCQAGLTGGRCWGRGATRREQAANFLHDYFDLFWQPDSKYKTPKPELRFELDRAGGISFNAYSQGLEVFNARLVVLFTRDGEISAINGRIPIVGKTELSPKLSPEAACANVLRSGRVSPDSRIPDAPHLLIYPSRPPRLMYSVFVEFGPHLLVDADTGEIYPGFWAGPSKYQAAVEGLNKGAAASVLPDSALRNRLGVPRPSVPTSLESVMERSRRVDGREPHWHEPTPHPLSAPVVSTRETSGGHEPAAIVKRLTGTEATRADSAHRRLTDNHLISYSIDDIAVVYSLDLDGDAYSRDAQLGVDIDLSPPSANAVLYLEVFGREPAYGGTVLIQTGQFPVIGADNVYERVPLSDFPHGGWDFRIDVYTYDGTWVASSTYGQFPGATSVALETAYQDAVFQAYGAYADQELRDWNGNGYSCTVQLDWAIRTDDGTHSIWSDFYISDGVTEWLLPTTQPYVVDTGHAWHHLLIAGKPHGHYGIRMILREAGTNQFLREFHYGELLNWTNIPLETGREDRGPSQVFDPNPVNVLNNPCLWDHHDSVSAVPSTAYSPVDLDSLNEPPLDDGFYHLSGAYVSIIEINPPAVSPPLMPGASYAYTRDETGFEATMAYYHITRSQEYIQSLGLGYDVCNRQVPVDVFANREKPDEASAYFPNLTGTGFITFGLNGYGGTPGVDNAEDADVIMHEYGHAIVDNVAPLTFSLAGNSVQSRWMDEGFANYWAGSSVLEGSVAHGFPPEYIGEWYVKNTPGCQPEYCSYGDLENNWTYTSIPCCPFDSTAEHRDAQPWEGALWDMLQALGKNSADRIIIEGYKESRGLVDPSVLDVARRFLAADTLLYSAAHAQQIINIFTAREFYLIPTCNCPLQGDINADLAIDLFDVIACIGIAYSGDLDPQDAACPTTRGDVNNDGTTDTFDVIYLIATAFSGGPNPIGPCAP